VEVPNVATRKIIAAWDAIVVVGCQADRHSSAGFRRSPDGDVERGKTAFVSLGCNSCQEVVGAGLPQPTIQPPVPVVLGGQIDKPITDGYLVTSIVYPAHQLGHQLVRYRRDEIVANGESRMPHYADYMTVRQLTDIVAFLQSSYTVMPRVPEYYH
jgi:hypothetical protein